MVFGMLKYRKDLKGLKTYVEKNRAYFSDIDEELSHGENDAWRGVLLERYQKREGERRNVL